jgi:hypothetical protein
MVSINKPEKEEIKVEEKVETEVENSPEVSELKATAKVENPSEFKGSERIPSTWYIKATGKDTIEAVNSSTNRRFEGTVKEFNSKLRG